MKNVFVIILLCLFVSQAAISQEISQWRGENSYGIYAVDKMLPTWPEEGPEILWHFDQLGQGFSSPVFANNKIYINGMIEGQAILFVLDLNGKKLQEFDYGKEFDKSFPGTRSTPTIAGDLAYLFTGHGVLTCLDLNSGKPVWKKDFLTEMDGINITWGYCETVVVDGDKVFVTPGGKTNNVVALNRMTGELIWSCNGMGELSAYCTPLLIKLPARELLVTHTGSHVLGIDVNSGNLLWNFKHPNQYSVHPNTPIFRDGELFVFSGYGQGGSKLKLSADGSSVSKDWDIVSFDSRMGGAVLLGDFIYGSGDKDRSWQCVNWKTGELKYSSTEVGKGVTISANNNLIGYSEKGELFMATADPSGFKVISKTKVTLGSEQHWAHPVIHEGVLYVRHGNELIAYKISE